MKYQGEEHCNTTTMSIGHVYINALNELFLTVVHDLNLPKPRLILELQPEAQNALIGVQTNNPVLVSTNTGHY